MPHPDDDVPGRGWNNSPARFFQKCYDRYLEHYEGYVRLAERLHQMRDEADAGPGTLGSLEWEDKLRRAYDAIERTTQRLDTLEEHYPELATDNDRIVPHRYRTPPCQARRTLRPPRLNPADRTHSPKLSGT